MSNETHICIEGFISEGQQLDREGHAVQVTLIRGGTSKNGYTYNEEALQALANMVEGAHAYADHGDANTMTRSIRDIVGFYHDAHYVPPDASQARGRVDATLHLFEAASWLWSLIQEACILGKPELIGLSVDILGTWQLNEASKAREVTHVLSLNSCDIVTRPSAGGAFRRILHSHPHYQFPTEGAHSLMSQDTSSTSSEQATIQETYIVSSQPETPSVSEQHMQELMHDLQRERAQLTLERRLLESVLPEPVRTHIRTRYQGRIVEAEEIDAEIQAQQEILATLTAQGLIRGNGYEKPTIGSMVTEAEKVQAAFDRMFDLDTDQSKFAGVRGFTSIREAYARVTGDASLGAGISSVSQIGNIRVSESAPMGRITEADTTTASFSYLLGTSMNKRLLKDY